MQTSGKICGMYHPIRCCFVTIFTIFALSLMIGFGQNWYNQIYRPIQTLHITSESKDVKLLILFTSLNYAKNREIVYNNTMVNWPTLGPGIQPVLFVDDASVTQLFKEQGWYVHALDRVTIEGDKFPVLKQMFVEIQQKYLSHFVGFVNADILFTEGLHKTMEFLQSKIAELENKNIMIIGRRTNVKNISSLIGSDFQKISKLAKLKGKLQNPDGLDLFITNHDYPWVNLPELVIGRPRFDNWMVLRARKNGHMTIDVTQTVCMLHQVVDSGSGRYKSNSYGFNININLLNLYYTNILLHLGSTLCTSHFTSRKSNTMVLNARSVPRFCFNYYKQKSDKA